MFIKILKTSEKFRRAGNSIKLPFKSTSDFVPGYYITSEKRLRSLKYKLDKTPKLKEQYVNILCEYKKEVF